MKFSRIMKLKYFSIVLLAVLCMSGCKDDDDNGGDGSPVITVSDVSPAMFGDSITVKVNCKDEGGVPLSTLKAALNYSNEQVQTVTIRTKTEGDYTFRMFVPFCKNVPDGSAQLKFTLQNIHLTKSEQTVDLPLTRPHFAYLTLKANDGTNYKLTPSATNPFLFTGTVTSLTKTVNGYVVAPAQPNGKEITFGEASTGITTGVTDNIPFTNTRKGQFEVTFNTLTFEYSPVYDPETSAQEIELKDADKANVYVGTFTQGRNYEFVGSDKFATDSWFYDPDFFTKNGDGTFRFNAATGVYTIQADFKFSGFVIWAMADTTNPLTLGADGSGAVWIIGSDCLNKPVYDRIKGEGWWTGVSHDVCLAQISSRVYQITLTVGKQLKADGKEINFKFFGQPDWGIEFKGTAADFHLTTDSPIFAVGDGETEYQGGKDDGNIYLRNGVTLKDGDTYVFTIDLTSGTANGILKIVKK
jgi:hypothetical protein